MQIINGEIILNKKIMSSFIEGEDKDSIVQLFIEETSFLSERPMKDLHEFFKDENVEKAITNDKTVLLFVAKTKILRILGYDYFWWIAPYRRKKYGRLKQLFDLPAEETKVETKQEVNTICCAIANIEDNVVTNIREYEDTVKNLIPILNKEYSRNVLQTRFKPTLKFCFNYKAGDNGLDIYDATNYKSFDELVNEGVFVL